eukprot:scaffold207_cov409-Prasinococcus_capsulatus_cf.AAC.80
MLRLSPPRPELLVLLLPWLFTAGAVLHESTPGEARALHGAALQAHGGFRQLPGRRLQGRESAFASDWEELGAASLPACEDAVPDCKVHARMRRSLPNRRWRFVPQAPTLAPGRVQAWAAAGECASNADFMRGHCPASCGVCQAAKAMLRRINTEPVTSAVYLRVSIEGGSAASDGELEPIVLGLFGKSLPVTCENFRQLAIGVGRSQ